MNTYLLLVHNPGSELCQDRLLHLPLSPSLTFQSDQEPHHSPHITSSLQVPCKEMQMLLFGGLWL